MKHITFTGNHYEIGFQYGAALRESGEQFLDHVPFHLTLQRMDFAQACLPVYERWFPAILDELRGLADGQRCSFEKLSAVLMPMYCIVPQAHCSTFALHRDGQTLLGRNSDFLTCIEEYNTNCFYRFTDGHHNFIGNTTAFVEMEDGINDQGLAVGLTSVQPYNPKPGFHAGLLLRMVLETCSNVYEAVTLLKKVPTASSHTLVLADRTGEIVLVESRGQQMEVHRPATEDRYVCATNLFHLPALRNFNHLEVDNWQAEERYQTLTQVLSSKSSMKTARDAMELLSGQRGFLCQYDRKTGKDTVWSVVYDLTAGRIYRAEGNPSRTRFQEDKRIS